MKWILTFIVGIVLFATLTSFDQDPAAMALNQVTRDYQNQLEAFSNQLELYEEAIQQLDQNKKSLTALRKAHLDARAAYKRVELLMAHIDPSSVKLIVNGAPLPGVVPNVPQVIPVEPQGLQVLEELVYEENPVLQKDQMKKLIRQLRQEYQQIQAFQSVYKLNHRLVFDAMRKHLIRVFALGVTGFDTPGSGQAIVEAGIAMGSIQATYLPYQPLVFEKDNGLAIVLDSRLQYAIEYIGKHPDFDTFDRLFFLKEHINPLYELLYQAQNVLGIESGKETQEMPLALNDQANSLFSENFFNKAYFTKFDISEPSYQKRAALGKLLFYDPVLSVNNELACASCHQPEKGFTDGLDKSYGKDGKKKVQRNTPTLLNCIYSTQFFYDLRQPKLEKQVMHVVLDTTEFASNYVEISKKLMGSNTYRQLFQEAYSLKGDQEINAYTIGNALASFVSTLNAFNSPFDQYVGEEIPELDPAAYRGFNLFMGKAACGTCHFAPVFNGTVPPYYNDTEAEVLGVPQTYDTLHPVLDKDLGRYNSGFPRDKAPFYQYAFKTVTVRNVALTAPYMHNGALKTLEEVVDFYNRGGGAGMGLDVPHQTLPFDNLSLNESEKKDLIAFMQSLTSTAWDGKLPDRLPVFEQHPEWNQRRVGGRK